MVYIYCSKRLRFLFSVDFLKVVDAEGILVGLKLPPSHSTLQQNVAHVSLNVEEQHLDLGNSEHKLYKSGLHSISAFDSVKIPNKVPMMYYIKTPLVSSPNLIEFIWCYHVITNWYIKS